MTPHLNPLMGKAPAFLGCMARQSKTPLMLLGGIL